ncbi:MAG TPA: pitrilysin family protein [Chloroflexia bacterium]|nr:pitrilysin family protein [Chloroflexia bacterium]
MIAEKQTAAHTNYELTTLDNGLRIITATMPHTRSAAVQFYVGVGARHEQPARSGVSHFVEHMVFKGTERRPNPVQISEAIEGVGGSFNACTDHEHTNYRALVPSDYFETAVDVITDMLRNPRLTLEDVEKERAVIIEEISSTYDAPGEIVDLNFDALLWMGHPLGVDVAGTKQTVKRLKRPDLADHMAQFYNPQNIVVSVAGNVLHEEVVFEIERRWGDLAPGTQKRTQSLESPVAQVGPRISSYKKRTEQLNLILGVPALPYTHPNRYVQEVLDSILGGGMSSRLFVELRENRGLAYSVSSFVKSYDDVGAFGVHAAIDNEMLAPALTAIVDELKRISAEAVPEIELRKVKEFIKGHTLLGLERSGYVAHWAGWQQLMLGRIDSVEEALERIEAVTAQDVQTLAGELFKTSNLHLSLVGPARSDEEVAPFLQID